MPFASRIFTLILVGKLATVLLLSGLAEASSEPPLPHMPLDLTGREYESLLKKHYFGDTQDPLNKILEAGKRSLQWLDFVNAQRSPSDQLELSTAATQRGYPIDAPVTSNRSIVLQAWTNLTAALPDQIRQIVLEGADFQAELAMSDEDFFREHAANRSGLSEGLPVAPHGAFSRLLCDVGVP
ncbi:hypothetical protein E3A20_06530 [Planctomyces bekefii]|uniref:Uncharacterized protein n=1 Tax=Planctomyces bekefii TaxID=1653850 RepID=A0A5C6M8I9_9PLAN|nr:hypothetical protein E3A20_06530 [Planctomyces bekefii]